MANVKVIKNDGYKIIPNVKKDPNFYYKWISKNRIDSALDRGYEKVCSTDKILDGTNDGKTESQYKTCRELILMRKPKDAHDKDVKAIRALTRQREKGIERDMKKSGLRSDTKISQHKIFRGKSIPEDIEEDN